MEAFDNLKLCAYLFVADSFDRAENIFDKYCPIIEYVLASISEEHISVNNLLDQTNEIFKLNMSKATLNGLLINLSRQGKITKSKNIITKNSWFRDSYSFEKCKKESEVNDLFRDFHDYLQKNEYDTSLLETKELTCKFIFTYSYELFDLINKSKRIKTEDNSEDFSPLFAEHFLDYLLYVKSNNPDVYKSFQRLHNGAVQATLLNFNINKIQDFEQRELKIEKIVLDSNFIMRVLDLQTPNDCYTAKDTLKRLQNKNIELIVLRETLEEISNTIKKFLNFNESYTNITNFIINSQNLKFNGLYAAMQRGKTRTDLYKLTLIENLKNILISENFGFNINEEVLDECKDSKLINSLIESKNREGYKEKQAQHDLALINWCRKNRKAKCSNEKDAKCWVLTNDLRLTNWNKESTSSNVQECISEIQLCHLMWIDEPKQDCNGLINTILTLANRHTINSDEVEAFLKAAEKHRQNINNPTEAEYFSIAFASDAITTEDIKAVYSDEEFFANLIKNKVASYKKEKEETAQILIQQKENESISTKLIAKAECEKDIAIIEKEITQLELNAQKLTDQYNKAKNTYDKYQKFSNRLAALIFLVFSMAVSIIIYFLVPWSNVINVIGNNKTLTTIMGLLGSGIVILLVIMYILAFFVWLVCIAFNGKPIIIKKIIFKKFFLDVFNKIFAYVPNKILKLRLRKKPIFEKTNKEDFEDYIDKLTTDISELNKELENQKDLLCESRIKLEKILKELQTLENH